MTEVRVFAGSTGQRFAQKMCADLGVPLSPVEISRFANDCLQAQLMENCRERDVYLVQPVITPTQESLMELLLMIDAAKGASARRITAVMPHFAYARSDKKDAPRISIGGRLVADLLETAGAGRVLTMTLHAPQVHAFFRVPVDQLNALRELASHFTSNDLSKTTVVSPDLGNAKPASAFAKMLGVPVAAAAKERFHGDRVEITSLIGDVAGRDIIVLDDEVAGGTTITAILDLLREHGARSVRIACTHGIFAGNSLYRIADDPDVVEIVTTDTVPSTELVAHDKLTIITVAPAFAEAVRRIHSGESVSALFDPTHV
ncbi:ribose-phosphate pyrophosphokinase [Myceligenerans cantabricum]